MLGELKRLGPDGNREDIKRLLEDYHTNQADVLRKLAIEINPNPAESADDSLISETSRTVSVACHFNIIIRQLLNFSETSDS